MNTYDSIARAAAHAVHATASVTQCALPRRHFACLDLGDYHFSHSAAKASSTPSQANRRVALLAAGLCHPGDVFPQDRDCCLDGPLSTCALDGISMAHARGPAQFDAESRGLARPGLWSRPGHAWAPGGRGGCRCHCPRFFRSGRRTSHISVGYGTQKVC